MPVTINRPSRRVRRLNRRAMLGSTALAVTLVLGGCAGSGWSEPYRETRTMIVPHIAGTALSVESANGSVEAISTDREDVSIEVVLRSPDLERLQFAQVNARREAGNTLHIWVDWPEGKRHPNEGASVSINIPDARGVTARTNNGAITIAGLGGDADLQTSNGTITIDTFDGNVYAKTSNGKLLAEKVSGDIEMYSTNGRINISDAFGSVRAETSNGGAVISTMPGNVGPIRVRTSNGPITLNLGEGLEGVLKCETSNGRVSVAGLPDARLIESSNQRVEIRLGNSEEISALRTSNGSVRVQSR